MTVSSNSGQKRDGIYKLNDNFVIHFYLRAMIL